MNGTATHFAPSLAVIDWTWSIDGWIIATGVLAACACALIGNFLILRRMSMMGDAISHAVLPGIAVAFLLSGSRDSTVMFLGAAAIGVLTAMATQVIHRFGRVEESASLGVVFVTLFAVGLILMATDVDLDPGCVLYGALETAPLNTISVGGFDIPWPALTLATALLVNGAFVVLCYKELKITSFDPELATSLGFNAQLMQHVLMGLIAATTVAAFEAVGSILVVAMLIVPGATASLLTHRMGVMIALSLVIAAMSAVGGHLGATTVPRLLGVTDTTTSASMAVASGLLFAIALVAAPRSGVLVQIMRRQRLRVRIAMEDTLGLLYRAEESSHSWSADAVANRLLAAATMSPRIRRSAWSRLIAQGLMHRKGESVQLTDEGRAHARTLVRSHRLWETYLNKHVETQADHLHESAMQLEHFTDKQLRDRLALETGQPHVDPHGSAIPDQDE